MGIIYDKFKSIAEHFPEKIALIDGNEQFYYQYLLQQANLVAENLLAISKQQIPRVSLLSENPKDIFCITIALAKIDGVCIPTNPHLTTKQLKNSWQAAGISIVIYDNDYARVISEKTSEIIFVTTDDMQQVSQFEITGLSQSTGNNKQDFLITLSSGSTGAPKPIVLSQDVKLKRAQQTCDLYDVTSSDTVLCASPFYHSLGQRLFFVPLLTGATLVYLKKFTPEVWLSAVYENKVTFIICVSSHLYALKKQLLSQSELLQSLITIVTSSAPIDSSFKNKLFKSVGCNFHEIYGATEIATATNLSPVQALEHHQTVGTACTDVKLIILDDNKNELAIDSVGEIAVKTPLTFRSYYKQKTATKNAKHNGYFLTGDLGSMNNDGFLTYIGRKKDIIISGGINIYPKDIEDVLLGHSAAKEVAVIGVNDDFLGEVILAICVCDNKNEPELRALANKHLAPFQRPLVYFFQDSLPLTASGKISKLALREKYNNKKNDWSGPLMSIIYKKK